MAVPPLVRRKLAVSLARYASEYARTAAEERAAVRPNPDRLERLIALSLETIARELRESVADLEKRVFEIPGPATPLLLVGELVRTRASVAYLDAVSRDRELLRKLVAETIPEAFLLLARQPPRTKET